MDKIFDDRTGIVISLPTPEEIKEAYTPEEPNTAFLEYENDLPDSPFLGLVVKSMKEFAEANDLTIFELYIGLGTQILLSEGLLELGDDE